MMNYNNSYRMNYIMVSVALTYSVLYANCRRNFGNFFQKTLSVQTD